MGFLGKVVSGLGNIIKPLAQTAIKAIAPKAIDTLKNIVGSGFDSLVGKAKGLLSGMPIVGPLLSGLADKLAPQLKNLGLGALEKGLTSLVQKFTGTSINGTNVVPGDLAARATASTAAAATASGGTGSASAAAKVAVGTGMSAFGDVSAFGGVNDTPNADKMIKEVGLDPNSKEAKQARAQERMQNIATAFQMISQMLQLQRQTLQTITGNIR